MEKKIKTDEWQGVNPMQSSSLTAATAFSSSSMDGTVQRISHPPIAKVEEFNWSKTETPLYQHLDSRTKWILAMGGMSQEYKLHSKKNILYYISFLRNVLIFGCAVVCYLFLTIDYIVGYFEQNPSFYYFLVIFGVLIQGISLTYACYALLERLNSPVDVMELIHYQEIFPLLSAVLFCFILTSLPIAFENFPLDVGTGQYLFTTYVFLSFLIQGVLFAINLLFILVDVQCCKQLILVAIERQNKGLLKLSFLNKLREAINHRVSRSALPNYTLMVTATYYLILILGAFLFYADLFSLRAFRVTVISLMCREIIFLMVSFWEAAKVNELADTFLVRLSRDVTVLVPAFQEESDTKGVAENENLENGKQPTVNYQELVENNQRFMIFMNISGDPLSFRLAGMRFSRQDILLRFGLWGIGIIIGLAKSV
jgi:hypothetical protein